MPKVSALKKAFLKKELLNPENTPKSAVLKAGFSKWTAHNATSHKIVKSCQAEILADIKKQITVESVLKSLEKIKALAIVDKDYSTATRCDELCGRWLAMWRDRLEIVPVEAVDGQFSVSRLARMRAIPVDITPKPDDR